MTKLILIRHGQTDYNLKKRYCGIIDISINNIGRTKTREIKNKLKGLKVDKVFCSNLKRSWQTAKLIFGNTTCPILKNSNLREINFGRWEGLNSEQILKKYPIVYKNWLKNPFAVDIPDGEKTIHFVTRITKEIKKIIKNNSKKNVAIVGHFGTMRVILNIIIGIRRSNFWQLKFQPQAIYIIECKSNLKSKVYKL